MYQDKCCDKNSKCQDKFRLQGAKFALLDCKGCPVACGVTNCDGELCFDCLPFGKYFIKEIEAPCGYEISCECAEVCIEDCREHRCVEFTNLKKNGSIKVIKWGKNC